MSNQAITITDNKSNRADTKITSSQPKVEPLNSKNSNQFKSSLVKPSATGASNKAISGGNAGSKASV